MDLGAKYIAAKATPNSSQNRNEHSLSVRHIDGKTVLVVLTELGRERLDAARPIHAEISSAESVVADHVDGYLYAGVILTASSCLRGSPSPLGVV